MSTGARMPADSTNMVPAPPKAMHFNTPRRDSLISRSEDILASRLVSRARPRQVALYSRRLRLLLFDEADQIQQFIHAGIGDRAIVQVGAVPAHNMIAFLGHLA